MRRLPILVLVSFVIAPLGAAQEAASESEVDCVSACVLPDRAPPDCDCAAISAISSTTTSEDGRGDAHQRAVALMNKVDETWRRGIADVTDYTAIQLRQGVPIPSVTYYEKESVDGFEVFRPWTPNEIQTWRAEQPGSQQPTPDQAGDMFGALGRALGGGRISEALGGVADELKNPMEGAKSNGFLDRLWNDPTIRSRAENNHQSIRYINIVGCGIPNIYRCNLALGQMPTSEEHEARVLVARDLEDIDLGPETEGYKLSTVVYWILDVDDVAYLARVRAVLTSETRQTMVLDQTYGEYMSLDRLPIPTRFRDQMYLLNQSHMNDFLAYLDRYDGWDALAVRSIADTILEYIDVRVNEGPPTAEEEAAMIAEVMQRMSLILNRDR